MSSVSSGATGAEARADAASGGAGRTSLDPARRAALLGARLRALARTRSEALRGATRDLAFPGGAAIAAGEELWVLVEEHPERSLGPCMILGSRVGVQSVNIVVDGAEGLLARRAEAFTDPPRVWAPDGTELVEASPDPVEPVREAAPEALALADIITSAGAEPVVEGGVLRAEVLGLEVGRVLHDRSGAVLEVGVGRHDREAHRTLHGDDPPAEVLAAAVREVRRHRHPGAASHPANQLSVERWLRAVIVKRPELVDLREARPIGTELELARPCPAPAIGEDLSGGLALIVCSVGVDLDLVPVAADVRSAVAASSNDSVGSGPLRLALVVPSGDDHPATRALAARLREAAEIRTLTRTWRGLLAERD